MTLALILKEPKTNNRPNKINLANWNYPKHRPTSCTDIIYLDL